MPVLFRVIVLLMSFATASGAQAEALRGSLFSPASLGVSDSGKGSLLVRATGGLFADRPAHAPGFSDIGAIALGGSDLHIIRALIQRAESRKRGYDAVQHGARIKPPKRPSQMTLAEIFEWIDDTPGQPHAIGRYQFVPDTLRRVVAKVGLKHSQRFNAAVQDQLSDVLLVEAGLNRFRAGDLGQVAFMNNLAKIWAGLPNSTGKSHYDNYAGNKASITWDDFEAVINRISPQRARG